MLASLSLKESTILKSTAESILVKLGPIVLLEEDMTQSIAREVLKQLALAPKM